MSLIDDLWLLTLFQNKTRYKISLREFNFIERISKHFVLSSINAEKIYNRGEAKIKSWNKSDMAEY